jgi:hypothetical protein
VLTIFWPDWIEGLTGYDPDQHDGIVEWLKRDQPVEPQSV